ncbi:MAG: hypothetical protein M3137_02400 [Actinomycetota bacterium]|nr:hypothetical protein [Actinomycetota bacterium]
MNCPDGTHPGRTGAGRKGRSQVRCGFLDQRSGGGRPKCLDHALLSTGRARQAVLDAVYRANADRFRNKAPVAPALPAEAWINKPTIHTTR